ncbi:1-aminocyclopropane-1-carboxylate deaminase/D-cysteine desulfhydrase [Kutzneria sp. 744]|uniref:1-aminocyclopropane-1-carboxylate deaminase/D-cysteine desulfhydrase n=1 Tax=Kutzneria sp. (strain 744) TaxID=345341 RepID=UPI0003EEBB12|nr:pyridoxal-phosphate dependent enzyme [Kutzneria sp. 744]EWM11312.1 1-aminocyclopropane-1-carboxylate deaminase [Kutzneria sp. 744]
MQVPSPLTELHDERLRDRDVRLYLKRDDLISPDVPGNKWRKLKYNLVAARERGHHTLLTFGGAYSNHIRATAAAGALFGFDTIGVIRGEEHRPLNDSLALAVNRGMRLTYMDRTTYRRKTSPEVLACLAAEFGDFYLVPEGGTNMLALKGCMELPAEIDLDFDVLCCACGTGGTLAGLAAGLRPGQHALGFSALKGGEFLADDVRRLQTEAFGAETGNWSIDFASHFGGYAKRTPELDQFASDFRRRHDVDLDRVYVAKMLHGVFARVRDGRFPAGSVVVAVVTG